MLSTSTTDFVKPLLMVMLPKVDTAEIPSQISPVDCKSVRASLLLAGFTSFKTYSITSLFLSVLVKPALV